MVSGGGGGGRAAAARVEVVDVVGQAWRGSSVFKESFVVVNPHMVPTAAGCCWSARARAAHVSFLLFFCSSGAGADEGAGQTGRWRPALVENLGPEGDAVVLMGAGFD